MVLIEIVRPSDIKSLASIFGVLFEKGRYDFILSSRLAELSPSLKTLMTKGKNAGHQKVQTPPKLSHLDKIDFY